MDTEGESVLVCRPHEAAKGRQLLNADLSPVESCLTFNPTEGLSPRLKRALLEVVVAGVTPGPSQVLDYVGCTLLAQDAGGVDTGALLEVRQQTQAAA